MNKFFLTGRHTVPPRRLERVSREISGDQAKVWAYKLKFRPARKAERSGNCLERVPGEITESVKTPINHGRTKRPYAALLYPDIDSRYVLRSIGGTLWWAAFGWLGGDSEIPPWTYFASNSLTFLFTIFRRQKGEGRQCLVGSLTGAVSLK